jgi:Na+-transporting NADH:ubiquinone oxidoreductase subunit B
MALLDGGKAPPFSTLRVHGRLTALRIEVLFVVALLPPLAQMLYMQGVTRLPVLTLSLAVAVGWQVVFSVVRKRPMGISAIVPAIAVTLMMPAGAPLWQVALGLTFGVVVGVHLFGGYGWNFLNPVAVALVFLVFSFPEGGYSRAPPVAWEACLPGAALLVATGIVSWRILAAASVALVVALVLLPGASIGLFTGLAGFVFVLVFLAGDPVAAPATDSGRWIYAVLTGVLAALGLASGKPQTEAFVSAVLLGGIFAPLIDYGVTRAQAWQRRRRRGRRDG